MKLNEWLKSQGVPDYVIRLLESENFPYRKEMGSVRFFTKSSIMELNVDEDWLPQFIKTKLLAVADAINGDFWVLDYRDGTIKVAITPHDSEIDNNTHIPDQLILRVADSFEDFLQFAKADELPIDYYEAKEI